MPIKTTYSEAFDIQLTRAQRASYRKVKKYYDKQSKDAIEIIQIKQNINLNDLNSIFKPSDLMELYKEMYVDIGLRFARWYYRNIEKYIKKGLGDSEIWAEAFRIYGANIAARRVTSVSGTAKSVLIRNANALYSDPEFQSLGYKEQGRLLRKKFSGLNKYQAERIVRTESTAAADYATDQSARSLFPGEELVKEWMAALDERTRTAHANADGQIVSANKYFTVGGERMYGPGDTSASAKNTINCRCHAPRYPRENSDNQIDGVNIGSLISTGALLFDVLEN